MPVVQTGPKFNMFEILCLSLLSASLEKIGSKIVAIVHTFSPLCLREIKGQVTCVNSPICPKIELIQDFMAVLIICKSDKDSIKNEMAIIQTTFS